MGMDIEDLRQKMQSGDVRIEIMATLNFTQGRMVDTARIYTRPPGGRWKKEDPLLLPPEGGTRADLLDVLTSLAREDVATPT